MKRAPTAEKRAGRTIKRAMEVGKCTIRVVGLNGIASGRAFIVGFRAVCEDGREVRTRNAPPDDVDGAFLALRSRPIDEKGEALANKAKPDASTARFTSQKGGPITLPSRFPDEEGEVLANKAAFTVQPRRFTVQ